MDFDNFNMTGKPGNSLGLFRSANNLVMIWVAPQTGDLVYVKYWRRDLGVWLVHFYPMGIQNLRSTQYDFINWNCVTTN